MHRLTAGQRGHRGPEWIVRCRDEDLVAVVEQRLHRHRDQLGDTVAEDHVVDVEVREVGDELIARHDGPPGGQHARGLGVPLGVGQGVDHVAHDDIGGLEAEQRRVADVELHDPVALGLQPGRVRVHRPLIS